MNTAYKTVLLIDDNETDNIINELLITASNFAERRIVKFSSEDALDFLRNEAIVNDYIPDIIFLDIRMPLEDGFEFLEKYKHLPDSIINKTQVVMLTSSFDENDMYRAKENKFVVYVINKPLTLEKLSSLKIKLSAK